MAEHGHNSVLEMGVLTLRVDCGPEAVSALFFCQPRFLQIDRPAADRLLVSGSVRAFREMLIEHPDDPISRAIARFLALRHPYFFEGLPVDADAPAADGITVAKVPLAEVERFPVDRLARHRHLAVKFIVNRAVTHELVRHRPCTFLQESQRYCRYADDKFGNEVTFIKPLFFAEGTPEFAVWKESMAAMERQYLRLLETSSAQAARTVLPNSCKTEIIVYANLAEWRHILALRTSRAAEPSMREVMIPLQAELRRRYPTVFA